VNFEDTEEEAAFRAQVVEFLSTHARLKAGDESDWSRNASSTDPEISADFRRRCREWQATLFDNGWAGITWPVEFGGRGGTPSQQVIFGQELVKYDVTSGFYGAAQALVGPTIIKHGTDEQRDRYVKPLLRGDEAWCQLFSEPEAGSDLANLATRAVKDGDEYVVNGQKVWTSSAQHADFGILLARTDPTVPKHRGISFFILDMRSEGVEVRPLVQAQGVAHFNEVFLTEVRVPAANLVGAENDGWSVGRTTLKNESSMIAGAGQASNFENLLASARRLGSTADPVVRQRLAVAFTNQQIMRFFQMRTQTAIMTGRYELMVHGSLMKNLFTRSFAQRTDVAVDLQGPAGTLWHDAEGDGFWQYQLINQFASRIGGGTEEVHRNNIAEQALGLPRELRDDLATPFGELRRR
jgi:alkylation response protein AidB-like acyl-CoA dehydrogenase